MMSLVRIMPLKSEADKNYRKMRYESLKSSGLCTQCKKPWSGSQVKCDDCRKADELKRQLRKSDREKAGICNRCGKNPVIEGLKYCESCYIKSKSYKDSESTKEKRLLKYHTYYKKLLRSRRKAYKKKGLCADCGKCPACIGVVCSQCYDKRRAYYEKSKLKPLPMICTGKCESCNLPYCIDDSEIIQLTEEEKLLSKKLDKQAKEHKRKIDSYGKDFLLSMKNKYNYAVKVIENLESKQSQGAVLSDRELKQLYKAKSRLSEVSQYVDTGS